MQERVKPVQFMRESKESSWVTAIPQDTEILYFAFGCADYGHAEKRYQAFPEFIQQAIDRGKKVKILAVDPSYGDEKGRNSRFPKGGYSQSALHQFLQTHPQYDENVSIYSHLKLEQGREYLEKFIQNTKNNLIVLDFMDCPYTPMTDHLLRDLAYEPAYLKMQNVHSLQQASPAAIPDDIIDFLKKESRVLYNQLPSACKEYSYKDFSFDYDAFYAKSPDSYKVISLKRAALPCKEEIGVVEEKTVQRTVPDKGETPTVADSSTSKKVEDYSLTAESLPQFGLFPLPETGVTTACSVITSKNSP